MTETDDPQTHALMAQLTRGLLRHGQEQTIKSLGDRSAYVGLSDIGKAVDCMRAAVASKCLPPPPDDIERLHRQGEIASIRTILKRQLVLQRGHWLESGVENAFRSIGANLVCQLEIRTVHDGTPIRAHIDFTFVRGGSNPAVRILELKSTKRLPKALYPAYEAQIYGQIGLLKREWGKKAFSLRNEHGDTVFENVTFPELVYRQFGFTLPETSDTVDIEGWVLCLSMSEAKAFGAYQPDATALALCQEKAVELWALMGSIRSGNTDMDSIPHCKGFHPLCEYCDHAQGCPKFQAPFVNDPALDTDLDVLQSLKSKRKHLDSEIDALEGRIRSFLACLGNDTHRLETDIFRVQNACVQRRKNLNSAKLRAALYRELNVQTADAILTEATDLAQPYSRLHITRI